MKYTMVLLVPFYRVSKNVIACESAFATHLKELLPRISQWGTEIVIHSPQMTDQEYNSNKHHLAHIDCEKDSISYVESYSTDTSRIAFLLSAPFFIWPKIWGVVKNANVIHASVSKDIFKLFTFISLLFAVIQGRKSIVVMDIDHRSSAKMSYKTGKFSYKSYFLSQYVYNPIISLQLRFVTKYCDLIMFKAQRLVDDYGKGREKVKNFYNTAHDLTFIINEQDLRHKINKWDEHKKDIKLAYFGRLVSYKGIGDMILAAQQVAEKLKLSGSDKKVSLSIIGAGEVRVELQNMVAEKKLTDIVEFYDALSYGDELFSRLREYDFLLAAPHSEDTPRSVFDAMACGLPMIAYDTYYYKDLERTGTVKTVPWLSVDALADEIVRLSDNASEAKEMITKCREFAVNNTQEIWLNKRLEWTKKFLG